MEGPVRIYMAVFERRRGLHDEDAFLLHLVAVKL